MRKRAFVLIGLMALVLAACTGGPPPRSASAPGTEVEATWVQDILLLDTTDGALSLEMGSGSRLADRPGAVAGPDGSRLFVASHLRDGTALEVLDAATGSLVSRTEVPGRFALGVASWSGRSVALIEPLPRGVDAWTPVPRARTSIVVADPTGGRPPLRYRLQGNFEPEAFSIDDSRLFLIQHLPAEAPIAYRVTVLDLETGEVRPVRGRYDSPPERMAGTRLGHVYAPDGSRLYTLYTSLPPQYAKATTLHGSGDHAVAFVHVLDLSEGWAHCAGVPEELWDRPEGTQAMVSSPDGERLYIADVGVGLLTVMDTRTLGILRTEALEVDLPASAEARASAVISPDGNTLFVASATETSSTVVAVDTSTWEATGRWTVGGAISGLAVSADGLRVYVALDDRIAVIDAATGHELTALEVSGVESILEVGTPSR